MSTVDRSSLPKYLDLMLPTLRTVKQLGGSGSSQEITSQLVENQKFSDEMLALTYDGRDTSVLLDRVAWARSYCKMTGVLESPKRGLFLLTADGQRIAELDDADAYRELRRLDRQIRRQRRRQRETADDSPDGEEPLSSVDDGEADEWKAELLTALHALSPDAFERFTLYLLRAFGMRLKRQGGPGDEGIDGLGTAPLTEVLTRTVAVQAKRYEPSKAVGREVVALFQSDAAAKGAEHGVLVTTGRFSKPAELAALGRTPTIDLIDGDRLAELCLQQGIGVETRPVVNPAALSRFEDGR